MHNNEHYDSVNVGKSCSYSSLGTVNDFTCTSGCLDVPTKRSTYYNLQTQFLNGNYKVLMNLPFLDQQQKENYIPIISNRNKYHQGFFGYSENFGSDLNLLVLSADSWCGYSKKFSALENDIKSALSNIGVQVTFVSDKQDKSNFDKLAKEHKVQGFPTSILFNGKQKIASLPGYMTPEKLVIAVKSSSEGDGNNRENYGNDLNLLVLSADSWCGYSKKFSALENDIKSALSNIGVQVTFVSDKQDKSNFDKLAKEHKVQGFPTSILFNGKQKIASLPGYMTPEKLVIAVKSKSK